MKTILVLVLFALAACDFVVTDPSDPRFNPSTFRFENYDNEKELYEAIGQVFPVGTKREEVEKTLIGSAHYRHSEAHEASFDTAGFSKGLTIRNQEAWNSENYFIDYASDKSTIEKGQGFFVRILYAGEDDSLKRIVGFKPRAKSSPLYMNIHLKDSEFKN